MKRPLPLALILFVGGWLLVVSALGRPSKIVEAQPLINLPANFVATILTDELELPVDMEIMPSGDFLVAEKGTGLNVDGLSKIKLVTADGDSTTTVLTISTNTYWDSGLIGLVLDPKFESNNYLYVLYSSGENALNWFGESALRLSRFTYNPQTRSIPPSSELILLDNLGWEKWHHGGGLAFDNNGRLYIGLGDMDKNDIAQNLLWYNGKILRIIPTAAGYQIPDNNPYVHNGAARHELYAVGLRNPFRIHYIDALNKLVFADVGFGSWEEINLMGAGNNYGWPVREGPCPLGKFQPCAPASGQYTDPLYTTPHLLNQGSAITGLAYYKGQAFPAAYREKLFFANYSTNTIAYLDLQQQGDLVARPFATNIDAPVDLLVANGKLYVVSIERGEIVVISYEENGQPLFDVELTANKLIGSSPLNVTFAATGIEDQTQTWHYRWNFGDGSTSVVTAKPSVNHVYQAEGAYSASVQVTGSGGSQSVTAIVTIVVYNGEIPELRLTNSRSNNPSESYRAGDTVYYKALRPGGTDDLNPTIPYSWDIDLIHGQHRHFLVRGYAGASGSFEIPTEMHDNTTELYYRFTLTMHTADGRDIPVTRLLAPEVVFFKVDSIPSNITFTLDGADQTTPHLQKAIIGEQRRLQAAAVIFWRDKVYHFAVWRQAPLNKPQNTAILGYNKRQTIFAPETNWLYTAEYNYQYPVFKLFMPLLRKK